MFVFLFVIDYLILVFINVFIMYLLILIYLLLYIPSKQNTVYFKGGLKKPGFSEKNRVFPNQLHPARHAWLLLPLRDAHQPARSPSVACKFGG